MDTNNLRGGEGKEGGEKSRNRGNELQAALLSTAKDCTKQRFKTNLFWCDVAKAGYLILD